MDARVAVLLTSETCEQIVSERRGCGIHNRYYSGYKSARSQNNGHIHVSSTGTGAQLIKLFERIDLIANRGCAKRSAHIFDSLSVGLQVAPSALPTPSFTYIRTYVRLRRKKRHKFRLVTGAYTHTQT